MTVIISILAVAGVIFRPYGLSEWIFAFAGSVILVLSGGIPLSEAIAGVRSGADVYMFLAGMMLLAEIARKHGLFDYLAGLAAKSAEGSSARLFTLVYGVGTVVTIFLSNDATAVVLTPAVIAVTRTVKAKDPVPYLLACAFVANAASFVLPISNPANIVIFGSEMPPLAEWLKRFTLPSVVAIMATYGLLFALHRRQFAEPTTVDVDNPALSAAGRIAAFGLIGAVIVLLSASWMGVWLGIPTLVAGGATLLLVCLGERTTPVQILSGISWTTLLLVAGLFVIVRAISLIGLDRVGSDLLEKVAQEADHWAPLLTGVVFGLLTNLTNNLPLGLFGGDVVRLADVPTDIIDALLIGIDLGPNISVTGSLATILWLIALRREGITVSAMRFMKIGLIITIPTIVLTLLVI